MRVSLRDRQQTTSGKVLEVVRGSSPGLTARFLKRSVSWVNHRAEDGHAAREAHRRLGLRFIPTELRAWVEGA